MPGQGHDIASSVVPRVVIHSGPNGHLSVAVVLLFLAPDLLIYTLVLKKFVLETFLVMRTNWSKKISTHKQSPSLSTASPRFVVMSVLPTFNLRASIKLLAPLNFFVCNPRDRRQYHLTLQCPKLVITTIHPTEHNGCLPPAIYFILFLLRRRCPTM